MRATADTIPSRANDSAATRMPGGPILTTPEGERALRRELALLREQLEIDLPWRLRQAREFGAASGNDDYLQIREEEAVIVARVQNLARSLASMTVIDPSEISAGCAGIGSTVTLRSAGSTLERRLLGAHEPIGSDGISAASPVGRAIMGRAKGESVEAEMPGGAVRTFEILAVEPPR